jgi:hypothetical protein
MTTKPTLREMIDACRPDQHDPQRPELAADLAPLARDGEQPEVAEAVRRSERFDRNVRTALDDVPLPPGLAERLLAKCEGAVITPAQASDEKVVGKKSPRRKFLAQLSIAASLLIVMLAAYPAFKYIFPTRPPVTADELAQSAVSWFDDCGPGVQWTPVNEKILTKYPLSSALRFRPKVFRQVDESTVAYYLGSDGKRAILFVHLPTRPHPQLHRSPYGILPATGGVSLGAWQRDEVVYVIGVTGSERRYPVDDFVIRAKAA